MMKRGFFTSFLMVLALFTAQDAFAACDIGLLRSTPIKDSFKLPPNMINDCKVEAYSPPRDWIVHGGTGTEAISGAMEQGGGAVVSAGLKKHGESVDFYPDTGCFYKGDNTKPGGASHGGAKFACNAFGDGEPSYGPPGVTLTPVTMLGNYLLQCTGMVGGSFQGGSPQGCAAGQCSFAGASVGGSVCADRNGVRANGQVAISGATVVSVGGGTAAPPGVGEVVDLIAQAGGYIDQAGNYIDRAGNMIDQAGNIVDQAGNVIGQADSYLNQDGDLVDRVTGDVMAEASETAGQYVDQAGNLIDRAGNTLATAGETAGQYVDQAGNVIDSAGNIITAAAGGETGTGTGTGTEAGGIQYSPNPPGATDTGGFGPAVAVPISVAGNTTMQLPNGTIIPVAAGSTVTSYRDAIQVVGADGKSTLYNTAATPGNAQLYVPVEGVDVPESVFDPNSYISAGTETLVPDCVASRDCSSGGGGG